MYFIAQLINGLGIGSIYALVALGYSMVYGIVKLINFAHGDIIMVGSYALFTLLTTSGINIVVAMLGAIVFSGIMGILIQRIAYRRLLNQDAPRIALLITAIGVSLFLQNLFQLIFGSESKTMPTMMDLPSIHIGSVTIASTTIFNVSVSVIMMVALSFLVNKTKMGKAMRATSEDAGAAKLMGINTNTTVAFTFMVGSALAGVAAILYTNTYPYGVRPTMGGMLGLKAFVAAVLGGIGNIPGAMLGGFVLGIAESLTNAYISTALVDAIVFGILIIILLFKPAGLLGKNIKEKV